MGELTPGLVQTGTFLPQGLAYQWQPGVLWLNVATDALIAAAQLAVGIGVVWFARRRPDIAFRPIFPIFAMFMVLCALAHLVAVVTVWVPVYWVQGGTKLLAATASIASAVMLIPLIPQALALPSARALQTVNAELEREITLRVNAELDLRAAYQELEQRVTQRTQELSDANERLTQEIQERRRTEQALRYSETLLRRLHDDLEDHIAERTSELTRTIAELESFSYSISHDLRAPLRAINGFAAILREEHGASLDDDGQLLLDRIARNASKMAQLIDGLLDFSRLARSESIAADVDMTGLARSVAGELLQEARNADIELTVHELPAVRGDEAMLRQVWVNLLSNALKFSGRQPKPTIEVAAERGEEEIVYRVQDNGVGFDMAYAEKLFGVFNRLHSADEFPGVGVGLAIVRRIVQRHGGRVWAESPKDGGSTFYFALPLKRADELAVPA
jgi:signal transduction histidine kinase